MDEEEVISTADDTGAAPVTAAPGADTSQDDSGAAPVIDTGEAAPAGRPRMPMDRIVEAGKETPVQAAKKFPGNVKRILGYLMGEGADNPAVLDQIGAQVDPEGRMSPDDRNLAAVQKTAETSGPEAAWKLVQANRVAYNAKQAFAYTALNGTQQKPPDLNAAIDAANQAATHVLDGSSVQFAPSQNGITATVKAPGDEQPRVFNLSIDAFRKYLNVGGAGQYDRVMGSTVPKTLAALAQGGGEGVSRLAQLRPQPKPSAPTAPAIDNSESDAYTPPAPKTNFGKTPSTLNLSGNEDVRAPEPDRTNYGEELEARAARRFPGITQQGDADAWMQSEEARQEAAQGRVDVAKAGAEGKVQAAQATGESRVKVAEKQGETGRAVAEIKTAGWKYASDAKTAAAQIHADQRKAEAGDRNARAALDQARKTIAIKRQTLEKLTPEEEQMEKLLISQGQQARPGQSPQPTSTAPRQQAPVPGAKLYKGQWYTRGPNGESVPVQ